MLPIFRTRELYRPRIPCLRVPGEHALHQHSVFVRQDLLGGDYGQYTTHCIDFTASLPFFTMAPQNRALRRGLLTAPSGAGEGQHTSRLKIKKCTPISFMFGGPGLLHDDFPWNMPVNTSTEQITAAQARPDYWTYATLAPQSVGISPHTAWLWVYAVVSVPRCVLLYSSQVCPFIQTA